MSTVEDVIGPPRGTWLARTLAIAEMQARDLLRRRAVLALLVGLPAAFYYSVPASEEYGLIAGSMGVSWAVAAAGVFGILGWRRADPRLALAGASPAQGLLGRLVILAVLGLGLVVLFAPQILWRSSSLLVEPSTAVLALVLTAVVAVPLGLAIGALVPRELEGTLVLIGVLGVGTSVPPDTAVAQSLPMWGPLEILLISAGLSDGAVGPGVVHALLSALVLLALASWSWRRRVRIDRRASATPRKARP